MIKPSTGDTSDAPFAEPMFASTQLLQPSTKPDWICIGSVAPTVTTFAWLLPAQSRAASTAPTATP